MLFFSFLAAAIAAQPADTLTQATTDTLTATNNVSDGPYFALGRGILFISFAIVFFAVCVAIGLLLAAAVALLFGFMVLGFLSAAVLHGLRKRSVWAGIRFALYAFLPFLGALFG